MDHLLNLRLIKEARAYIHRGKLVIVIVAGELGLNRVTSKRERMLLKFFILLVLPVLVNIFLIKVVLFGRHKWRLDLLVPQVFPREIFEPGMLFDL